MPAGREVTVVCHVPSIFPSRRHDAAGHWSWRVSEEQSRDGRSWQVVDTFVVTNALEASDLPAGLYVLVQYDEWLEQHAVAGDRVAIRKSAGGVVHGMLAGSQAKLGMLALILHGIDSRDVSRGDRVCLPTSRV